MKFNNIHNRSQIFQIKDVLIEAGFSDNEILEEMLRYFSTDKLKEFFQDFTRLRDFNFNLEEE